METIKYTIYKLTDPITNEIRYIGLTFNNLKQRLGSHLSDVGKTHKNNWIKKLKSDGLRPTIEPIEEGISSYEEACLKEIYYIDLYRKDHNLTNAASGGNKNKKMSDETRKKMSESAKNKNFKLVLTDEMKKVLSIWAIEKFKNDDERQKLRIANKRYEDSKTPEQKLNDILIQKTSKFVVQYDKEMNYINEFPSIKEARRKTGVEDANISKCCHGKVKSAGGFIWKFK